MNKKLLCLSLGLGCLISSGSVAVAGGFGDDAGGLKDSIYAGVPVPAPSPVPMYSAEWYVRADAGYSFSTDTGASVNGGGFTTYGGNIDGPAMLTLGFGRYLSPSIRAEFALDLRNDYKVGSAAQSHTGNVTEDASGAGRPGGTNTHYYDVTRTDEVRIGNYSGMVNLYYDFQNKSRFTPYVGGGAGVVIHTLKRSHSESATCNYSTNDGGGGNGGTYTDGAGNDLCTGDGGAQLPGAVTDAAGHPVIDNTTSNNVETGYGLAANIMAGVSYEIGNNMLIDVNYRYMWMGGDVKIIAPTLNRTSTVNIGDSTEHQFRVGVRMNID